ncbi:hypothetical protein ACEUBL_19865, partial [Aeromonas veronii]
MSILSDDFKSELYPEMESFARNYFVANADDLFPLDQVFDYDYPNNEDKATESLFKLIEKNFNELKIPLSDDTVESIVDAFDIYGQMSNYFDGYRDEQHEQAGREREHIVKLTSIQPALNPIPFPDMGCSCPQIAASSASLPY